MSYVLDLKKQNKTKNENQRNAQRNVLFPLDNRHFITDLDIEAYFDTVNHDKLISILREKNVNDSTTLHLIRKFMQAGIMEDGLVKPSRVGVQQGGLCRYRHKPPYAEKDIMPS